MGSIGRFAGELTIDHTNSPGFTEQEAARANRMGGVAVAGSTKLEVPTFTCAHCNRIVILRPERSRDREVCRKCMKVVCDEHSLWCTPFAALVDAITDGRLKPYHESPLLVPGQRI